MRIKYAFLSLAFCYAANSYAFFCPTNFNQIEIGDTLDKVTALCGKPAQTLTSNTPAQPKAPQQWEYYLPQQAPSTYSVASQGTLKVVITFDANGSVINLSMNGASVGTTSICGGNAIRIGDTMDRVKQACGTPGFVNQQTVTATGSATPAPAENKTVTLIYTSNPPVSLIFQNGVLTEKK